MSMLRQHMVEISRTNPRVHWTLVGETNWMERIFKFLELTIKKSQKKKKKNYINIQFLGCIETARYRRELLAELIPWNHKQFPVSQYTERVSCLEWRDIDHWVMEYKQCLRIQKNFPSSKIWCFIIFFKLRFSHFVFRKKIKIFSLHYKSSLFG